jgi:phosphotriesterase-related protein
VVRTVLGDVPAPALGPCYAHEHIIIDESFATSAHPHLRLPSVDNACAELAGLRRLGVGAVVDAMPTGAGRSARKLAEISRRTGVHVVAPTGLHLPKYYPPDHWRYRVSAEELARLFVREIEDGIDDTGTDPTRARGLEPAGAAGPVPRAGLVKIASEGAPLEPSAEVLFEAAALAHAETGAPLMVHCEERRGPEQIEALARLGVAPGRVILSHTDRTRDEGYHRALLSAGARLAYDRPIRGPLEPTHPTVGLVARLLPAFPDQILFATDAARATYWSSYGGGPGLAFLYTTFVSWLRAAGVDEALVRRAFVDNAAAAFSLGLGPARAQEATR